jgi:hypothetical protein
MSITTNREIKVNANWAKAYVRDHDGVVCWKSNDRSPFEDMVSEFLAFGLISQLSYDNTVVAKDEQDSIALDDFFSRKPTREQLFEMNANKF